ncbi:hypothetical protein C1O63_0915 [Dehalococcoides mccartyi]|nr:hypothetical protein C1O63_0915 [Dehalococcoides mccartyi]
MIFEIAISVAFLFGTYSKKLSFVIGGFPVSMTSDMEYV